jgi:phosphoglycerate dehydrogenase-like enzyme
MTRSPWRDYLVIGAPETQETKHFIGAAQIGRMKRGARVINVGRGSLLDERHLSRRCKVESSVAPLWM